MRKRIRKGMEWDPDELSRYLDSRCLATWHPTGYGYATMHDVIRGDGKTIREWAQCGFVTLDAIDDAYAAALACSDPGELDPADIMMPARSTMFMLRLPGAWGAICSYQEPDLIAVAPRMARRRAFMMVFMHDQGMLYLGASTMWDVLCGKIVTCERGSETDILPIDDAQTRLLEAARRLVLGLILAYPVKSNWTYEGVRLARVKKLRGHEPSHRLAILGRPVRTDVREGLRRFLGGEGKSPTVQFLVRGHYRNQPHGPQNSKRKIIWIQPHWKGPEEGLILARPHAIGPEH